MAFLGAAAQSATSTNGDTSKDIGISKDVAPTDSVSDLMFSPVWDHLAVSSWDGSVRIFEISSGGVQPKWLYKGTPEKQALCVAWSKDGTRVASGDSTGVTNIITLSDQTPAGEIQATPLNSHSSGVKCVRWYEEGGKAILVTGSWDKTIKFWDLSGPNPAFTITCSERVYTMDLKDRLLVVGTAERHIHMINLDKPNEIAKSITSPLKWQTRVVSCFTDASGFAIGSIEGRCAIQYVKDENSNLNFSFKCHRQQDQQHRDIAKVYSVNAISFHPQHGTFSTAGSDGTFHFWDKDAKHRLKGYPETGGSITATAFSRNGDIFAYAVSYDWSKGYSGNTTGYPIEVKLHPIVGDECKPRPNSKKR